MRLGAEEIVVPNAQESKNDRHILLHRCSTEMLVHHVGAGQQLFKIIHPDIESNCFLFI